VSGPEPAVALLALRACQPAERIDPPAGCDGTSADISFAERSGIGVPGDAGTHLAPHNRHTQLVTDHRPLGTWCTASRPRASHGPSTGAGLNVSTGLRAGAGLGGKDLNLGDRPVQPGSGGLRLRASGAYEPRLTTSRPAFGAAVVAQFGKPPAHLEHAGVIWPNVGLHLKTPPSVRGKCQPAPLSCRPARPPCGRIGWPLSVRCAGLL